MKESNLKKSKGFTLVELLVVIAILAVLATVSIVGYTSFTKKAKVSNDVSLTTQMNTILQANEVVDGKNTTPHEAVNELIDGGLDVTKLTPTANGYNYVYDLDTNRMILVDESMNVIAPEKSTISNKLKVFAFVGSENELTESKYAGYSFYLKNGFESDNDVTVSTSVDTGDNVISKLTYTNTSSTAQNVIVRTNGGTLEINAPLDTVNHFATADNVIITAVANSSYHENGEIIASMEVKSGRVVIEEKASVKELIVSANATSNTSVEISANCEVKTLNVESTTVSVIVAENSNVENIVCDNNDNLVIPTNMESNKISKTYVSDMTSLETALKNGDKYITFSNDIEGVWSSGTVGLSITSDTILDGNNFKFTTSGTRGIWIDKDNVNATIKNLELVVNGTSGRGIQVNVVKNIELLIENVNVSKVSHYGINVVNDAQVNLTISNSHITGYGALNLWSADYQVRVSNSVLESTNPYLSNDGDNDYATICLEGNLEGLHSTNVDVQIVNSEIIANATNTANQAAIIFNVYSIANRVSIDNTKITLNGENTVVAQDFGASNKLYIDGEQYKIN